MVSAPPLCVGHTQASTPKAALEHKSPALWGWVTWQSQRPWVQESWLWRGRGVWGSEPVAVGVRESALAGALPNAHGGRGWCMGREASMATLPFVCPSTMALCFYGDPGFFQEDSWLRSSFLPSPQAVSLQRTAVLSLGLLSKPHVPAPSPWARVSVWDMQGCGLDPLCRSHSVLPATDRLLHSPLSPQSSPSVPDDLLSVGGLPQMWEPVLTFSSTQGCRSHPASSPLPFSFFLSSYPVMQESFLCF